MKDEKVPDSRVIDIMNVVKAGLNRFYTDGNYRWSKSEFLKLFYEKLDLSDLRVQEILDSWEKSGWVRLDKNDDQYITVLKRPPA